MAGLPFCSSDRSDVSDVDPPAAGEAGAGDGPRARRLRILRRAFAWSVAAVVAGNLAILGAFGLARVTADDVGFAVDGVDHLRVVDERLWRGDAPSPEGYANLARQGVTTVIDLRAERDVVVPEEQLEELGIGRIHIPIRDGQTPEPFEVERFLDVVAGSEGIAYVHCGAGVGRTGTMAAAWLVDAGEASGWEALRRNLAVGPPSLEQMVFVAGLGDGDVEAPGAAVTVVSRLFDGPRRVWTRLRS